MLYVAVTRALPDLVKVGRSQDPGVRLRTYDSGIPHPYTVAYAARFSDVVAADATVKRKLRTFQEGSSECYRTTVEYASRIIKGMMGKTGYEYPPPGYDEYPILLRDVGEIEFTVAAESCLVALGVQRVGDLVQSNELALRSRLPNKVWTEVTEWLDLNRLEFGMRIKRWPPPRTT